MRVLNPGETPTIFQKILIIAKLVIPITVLAWILSILFTNCKANEQPNLTSSYNICIGYHAGMNIVGSYNVIVSSDSIGANFPGNTSYQWHVNPDSAFLLDNPMLIKCLLTAYPHVFAKIPESEASEIFVKSKFCIDLFPINFELTPIKNSDQ